MRIHFKDPMYDVNFFIYIGNDLWDFEYVKKDLIKTMCMKKNGRDDKILFDDLKKVFPKDQEGMCYNNCDLVIIFLRDFVETAYWYSVLSHEIFHATDFVMDMIGSRLSEDTKEPYAYYNGFLHKQTYNQLWKVPKEKKKKEITSS